MTQRRRQWNKVEITDEDYYVGILTVKAILGRSPGDADIRMFSKQNKCPSAFSYSNRFGKTKGLHLNAEQWLESLSNDERALVIETVRKRSEPS